MGGSARPRSTEVSGERCSAPRRRRQTAGDDGGRRRPAADRIGRRLVLRRQRGGWAEVGAPRVDPPARGPWRLQASVVRLCGGGGGWRAAMAGDRLWQQLAKFGGCQGVVILRGKP